MAYFPTVVKYSDALFVCVCQECLIENTTYRAKSETEAVK